MWTPEALPSVIVLTRLPADLADQRYQLPASSIKAIVTLPGGEHLITCDGEQLSFYVDPNGAEPAAVLLPLDRLFDTRVAAALRLWRGLVGRRPGPDPAALSKARRDRLILALRALDARLEGAVYREIATGLFGANRVSDCDWISHDLRDRTARLVRLGLGMMRGGYRRLLLHPYRGRS